jgi:hypothetical protein
MPTRYKKCRKFAFLIRDTYMYFFKKCGLKMDEDDIAAL